MPVDPFVVLFDKMDEGIAIMKGLPTRLLLRIVPLDQIIHIL